MCFLRQRFGVRRVVDGWGVDFLLSIIFLMIGYTIGPYLIAVLISLFNFISKHSLTNTFRIKNIPKDGAFININVKL